MPSSGEKPVVDTHTSQDGEGDLWACQVWGAPLQTPLYPWAPHARAAGLCTLWIPWHLLPILEAPGGCRRVFGSLWPRPQCTRSAELQKSWLGNEGKTEPWRAGWEGQWRGDRQAVMRAARAKAWPEPLAIQRSQEPALRPSGGGARRGGLGAELSGVCVPLLNPPTGRRLSLHMQL